MSHIAFVQLPESDSSAATLRALRLTASDAIGDYMAGELPALGLASNDDVGNCFGGIPVQLRAIEAAMSGYMFGELPDIGSYAMGGVAIPDVGVAYATLPQLTAISRGFTTSFGNVDTLVPLSILAFDGLGYAKMKLPALVSSALQMNPPVNYFTIVQTPGYVICTSKQTPPGELLADMFTAQDTYAAQFIHALFDLFTAHDAYVELATALQSLHDNLSFYDLARLIYTMGLTDTFVASAVAIDTAQILALLSDGFVVDETADAKSQILAALRDGFYINITINTGEDTYTAWVMTPQTKALRSYSNWPFNSYAQLGNMQLAAGPEGVYRLGGTQDITSVIMARIRSGLLDFGTSKLKRIDRAYLGYSSSGTLCLRICALSESGSKVVYTYQMTAQPAGAPVGGRVSTGRGPRSVYWSFELCNDASGSDFELHDISVLPMVLTGRII